MSSSPLRARLSDDPGLLDAIERSSPPSGLQLLRAIDEEIVERAGFEYFRTLARGLADALDTRYAFVARFDVGDYETMRIITFWDREAGQHTDDYPFPVAGTPCAGVLERRIVALSRGVSDAFPAERRRGVQSYLAIPLIEPAGRVAGHLVVADTHERDWSPVDERIIALFARRTIGELARHQYERALVDARAAVDGTEAARAEALSYLAHELRTPLHGILGHLELLARTELDGDAAASVDAIRRCAERLRSLVADGIALARRDRGTDGAPAFDLGDLAQSIAGASEALARSAGVSLRMRFERAAGVAVRGDEHLLRRVLVGCIARTIEASAGGRVLVAIEVGAEAGVDVPIHVEGRAAAPEVELLVTILGSAAPDIEPQRRLVALAGGRSSPARQHDAGTTFTVAFALPRAGPDAQPANAVDQPRSVAEEAVPAELAEAMLDAARSGDVGAIATLLVAVESAGAPVLATQLRAVAGTYDMTSLASRLRSLRRR